MQIGLLAVMRRATYTCVSKTEKVSTNIGWVISSLSQTIWSGFSQHKVRNARKWFMVRKRLILIFQRLLGFKNHVNNINCEKISV